MGKSNKDRVELYDATHEIVDLYSAQGEEAVQELLKQHNIASIWEAIAIIDRAKMGPTVAVPLNALTIGEVSMVFTPFEMFGDTAKYIAEKSPYDMTAIITCSNDSLGYFPTEKAYSYQVYEGFVAKVVPGTAEQIADTLVNMLKDMKG